MEAPEEPGTQVTEATVDPAGQPFHVRDSVLEVRAAAPLPVAPAAGGGRRLRGGHEDRTGLYVRARVPRGALRDLAVDATLRAAALRRHAAGADIDAEADACVRASVDEPSPAPPPPRITRTDLREKVRIRRAGAALTFVLDTSGSMARSRRMVETKAAVLSLLMNAYVARDWVSLVAFRGHEARLVLPFTTSVEQARTHLEQLPAGGQTPLAEGLRVGLQVAVEHRRRHPEAVPLLVVISDGKPNWGRRGRPVSEAERLAWCVRQARIPLLFLDTDLTWHEPGMGQTLARITRGRYVALADLSARQILTRVTETASLGRDTLRSR